VRVARLRLLALGTLALLGGCASDQTESEPDLEFQTLVALGAWSAVARDADRFITDLDAAPACVGPGFRVEQQWLEIDTAECNWVTLEAAARYEVKRGQELRVTVSHFDLNAPSAAEGVAELAFGGCATWKKVVMIPSAAAVYTETFASPCEVAAQGRVYFHLHNHGQNNWQLQDLSLKR
jgi:hypothetical protein